MTVKQVSALTGVSVRTLQYYDEIGLLKPKSITAAGYRLYDEKSLETLQQILFFKELDFPLKDIKLIMQNPQFDRQKALTDQKKLIKAKLDRLSNLSDLIDRLLKGENDMSFKEFDMTGYFNTLDDFKENHLDEIIKYWGSLEEYEKMQGNMKEKESVIGQMAVKQYGSIEKYTEAMKKNLDNFTETMDRMQEIKDTAEDYIEKNKKLHQKLTSDLTKDTASDEIQGITGELMELINRSLKGIDMGDNYWDLVTDGYLTNQAVREATDKIYGEGASDFIGRAITVYFDRLSK
ncbi:DNA-binding transcriptional regulator, MerR family [Anaerocolumna xylanovorans DSM 12503]|uniref:DNA-binding transcriptional regulator, MerR family n=2 Tax=Anaerocolumna TaxID=1843210 RepID=A0A1M7XWV9_9FIRM|nr:DNA-binding transcriptional regulator, MerR family [Anaerocolumna xylanovorans DSM 12503]